MGELIQFGDFKKKESLKLKNNVNEQKAGDSTSKNESVALKVAPKEEKTENIDSPYVEIDKPKEELILQIKKSSIQLNKETISNAQKHFDGWTNTEIAEFINNTDESMIKKKPSFFIYAYNKMRSKDSMIKLSPEDMNPIKDGKDSREKFFDDFFK